MIGLQYSNSSRCNVPADLENVSRVSNLLREYCELRLLDPVIWTSLELGFCEARKNAIEKIYNKDNKVALLFFCLLIFRLLPPSNK